MDFDTNKSLEFSIDRTAYLLRANTREALRESGWERSTEETIAMLILYSVGKSLSMGQLAEFMIRDATTVKRQLDGLVDVGFVSRETSSSDRRQIMVSITREGETALDPIFSVLQKLRRNAFAGVSRSDRATVLRVLATIRDNLD